MNKSDSRFDVNTVESFYEGSPAQIYKIEVWLFSFLIKQHFMKRSNSSENYVDHLYYIAITGCKEIRFHAKKNKLSFY